MTRVRNNRSHSGTKWIAGTHVYKYKLLYLINGVQCLSLHSETSLNVTAEWFINGIKLNGIKRKVVGDGTNTIVSTIHE